MAGYELTYIYHDCFMLETEQAVFVFDYWKDPLSSPDSKDFPPLLNDIDPEKNLYILVSHHHKDHFSRRIFLWAQKFPYVHYIISRDVYKAVKYMLGEAKNYVGFQPPENSVNILSPGEAYIDDIVRIKAFASTDLGNSYAVECDGFKFFHAGDLNAWLWIDESTEDEIEEARRNFTRIVDEIKLEYPDFDLAMFPVDSRLGREYWWGAKYFVHNIPTSLFVPMHFELVLAEEDKEPRRRDAGAFSLFARSDFGAYLQLASSRDKYYTSH